ncbi:MAG: hypothetical protein KJ043_02895, partial [Anaerolineae bacterium]|nr:hypothetical protein [Anaerolineae bacterium]
GSIIHKTLSQLGTADDFLGISDDEFVVMTYAEDIEKLQAQATTTFNEEVKAFYAFTDVEAGGIMMDENTSDAKLVPLMTMTSKLLEVMSASK